MVKVWKFYYEDDDGNTASESLHATEDIAYRAACRRFLEDDMKDFDFDDEPFRLFLHQFLACVEAADFRAAMLAYDVAKNEQGWCGDYIVEAVDLVPESDIDIVSFVAEGRRQLKEAEAENVPAKAE